MQIFVFGNQDTVCDAIPKNIIDKLKSDFKEKIILDFIKPNQDIPLESIQTLDNVVILDRAAGIDCVTEITEKNINSIKIPVTTSVHDFGLGFQLKYLNKLGKINKFTVIALPINKTEDEIDYSSIHSIVKKLVAQDIQGS